jgi:hypothetical protein
MKVLLLGVFCAYGYYFYFSGGGEVVETAFVGEDDFEDGLPVFFAEDFALDGDQGRVGVELVDDLFAFDFDIFGKVEVAVYGFVADFQVFIKSGQAFAGGVR